MIGSPIETALLAGAAIFCTLATICCFVVAVL
jgi:hypothetical protein